MLTHDNSKDVNEKTFLIYVIKDNAEILNVAVRKYLSISSLPKNSYDLRCDTIPALTSSRQEARVNQVQNSSTSDPNMIPHYKQQKHTSA